MAEIIDGKKISAQIKEEVKQEAERLLKGRYGYSCSDPGGAG